ncbi:conserved hypothetical protein [Talaromyces stipitatus ATCC 10500]|uniref:Proline-rich protein RiP-15 n=1 Tax=Talaromyces stipitatus (strain ATCC 10500 / CBS 375.48 / QM 6759 / NRRL 1006) TaxID=441959 RepID=B8M860_TALSN|nr:uncharacterized protein TSTA_032750 [Talaromyces stipitatus ATCC 10500]EED20022.1 conserved hypothetical protein [Talaromyces stipitatus ATCC 10500]
MEGPPPPPPPHGANPNTTEGTPRYRKSTDLPDGPYDIFVIPPHSAGGGFLYLPSLQCHRNSFIAGSLSTLAVVGLWILVQPIVKTWLATSNAPGGMGIVLLVLAVGFAGWYFGTLQNDGGATKGSSSSRPRPGAGFANGFQYGGAQPNPGGAYPGAGPRPTPQYNTTGGQYNPGGASQPPPFNNHGTQPNGAPQDSTANNAQSSTPKEDPKKAEAEWERAREETKRKEEIRRKMEAYRKKREAEEAERRRQQEREAMERELKQRKEELEREAAAAKAAAEKEIRERAAREAAEREERIRKEEEERAERARKEAEEKEERARKEAAEKEERARKEAAEKEAAAKEAAKKEAAARFAAAKEAAAKKFAAAKEAAAKAKAATPAPAPSAASAPIPPRTPSPKKAPPPSARTADVEDDAYSFRPYDRPRRPYGTSAPSVYSESSYAPSQSTARTTPPPSHRGPYMTKDPDKVIIRGVYLFNNAFQKTPIAQLVSGQGSVTDGLILRITTEGLFIDDDVRGVAQREWDVKAWTLKSIETIKLRGLQVVRASVRDQEGKRYVIVLAESEVWKVTLGFKKLKSGSQARHLSQSELSKNEANTYLTNLGY